MTESKAPDVSVVITSRDRPTLLVQAVDSVLAQTHANWEMIVVDDGSTVPVLESVLRDPRIRGVRHETSRGIPGARNVAIRMARGRFVAFLDDDDLWEPNKLALQLAEFERHPQLGMCGGGCIFIDLEGRVVSGPIIRSPEVSHAELCVYVAIPGSTSNVMIRREVLDDVGLFDEQMLRVQDWHLWLRIAEKYPVRCVPQVTVRMRAHRQARPNLNIENIMYSRERTLALVKNPVLRQIGWAWTYYRAYERCHEFGDRRRAASYLMRSFIRWPLPMPFRRKRLVPVVRRAFGG